MAYGILAEFREKNTRNCFGLSNSLYLCNRKTEIITIGLWCNGNTTDSGPVIPGSNPGSPTNLPYLSQKTTKIASFSGFLLLFDHVRKFQCRYSVANSVTRLL